MSQVDDVPLITSESVPAPAGAEAPPLRHPPIHTAKVDLARREEVLRILQEARQRDEMRALSRHGEHRD